MMQWLRSGEHIYLDGICRGRPSPPGSGLRVRRLIVARGCCWLFEIAPGIDEVLRTDGAVSGDVVESGARVVCEISTRDRVSTGGGFWGHAGGGR